MRSVGNFADLDSAWRVCLSICPVATETRRYLPRVVLHKVARWARTEFPGTLIEVARLNRKNALVLLVVLFATIILQSCVGAGDMFAEKRTVVGDYFLMTDEGDGRSYFLFRRGHSGSITGSLRAIGWDKQFMLAEDYGTPGGWALFAINPQRDQVPADPKQRHDLLGLLRKTLVLRAPEEVWLHSRPDSWFTRPFS